MTAMMKSMTIATTMRTWLIMMINNERHFTFRSTYTCNSLHLQGNQACNDTQTSPQYSSTLPSSDSCSLMTDIR